MHTGIALTYLSLCKDYSRYSQLVFFLFSNKITAISCNLNEKDITLRGYAMPWQVCMTIGNAAVFGASA